MIRLKPQRKIRIPNRLALAAALALVLTSYTGMEGSDPAVHTVATQEAAPASEPASEQAAETAAVARRFSVSRLLFGHG